MKTTDKLLIGLLAGAGASYGLKSWLRSKRRIDLAGRVVVITGGTTGLGLLLAKQAAERGASLVLAARDSHDLEAAEVVVRSHGARDVLTVPTDVADADQAQALIAVTIERLGRIDVLLNNAGVMMVGPVAAMTLDDYRNLLGTNFWGAVHTTLAALPHMRAARSGRIANIISIGGKFAAPHMAPYIASKFALTGFTKALRAELTRDDILVTGIYPQTIRTGGHAHAWFKGDRQAEYTWFALGDTVPGLAISADATARNAWTAICDGDPELLVGLPTRIAVVFDNLFPEWSAELTALIERSMPGPVNLDGPAVQGKDLGGAIPGLLSRLIPAATRPNGVVG